jgi:ATP phosphoribosyltransferase
MSFPTPGIGKPQPTIHNIQNLASTERIVYMNEALNGLHGEKLRLLAEVIMNSRMTIYQNLKNTSSDELLIDTLETKLESYMESKNKKSFFGKKNHTNDQQKTHEASKAIIAEVKPEEDQPGYKELNFRGVLRKIRKTKKEFS